MALSKTAATRKDVNASYAPMQHRHFATVAKIIRKLHREGGVSHSMAALIADHFAWELAETNANFDKSRFIAACLEDED